MLARRLVCSAITLGFLISAVLAGDKAEENAAVKTLAKQLEAVRQNVAGGALVVEAAITIDGRPFHEAREKLVDEMLKLATDKDGKATWAQAIANSRRIPGQVAYFANDDQRKQYLDSMDVNHDGLVDRY